MTIQPEDITLENWRQFWHEKGWDEHIQTATRLFGGYYSLLDEEFDLGTLGYDTETVFILIDTMDWINEERSSNEI